MTVACRLDGPQHRSTIEPTLETTVLRALAEALGVLERDPLLDHLARCWHQVTGADTAVLAAMDVDASSCHVCMVDAREGISRFEYQCPDRADLIDGLIEAAGERISEDSTTLARDAVIRRALHGQTGGPPMGALLLFGATPLPDELDRHFTSATAALLSRVVESDRLLREAKLASLAEFAAGAGHEINNPLAAISGRAQLLLRAEQDPERRRHLATIGAQALRIRDMIGDTMLFARPPLPEPQRLNLARVLDTTVNKFAGQMESRAIVLRRECDANIRLWADEAQLRVVISELVRNAIEASPPGGTISIEASSQTVQESEWVQLIVQDEGPGLTVESAEHLFDPFYSGRQAGRGLGFGLSKCWRIVTNHGGRIDVAAIREGGCGIVVRWPAHEGSAGPRPVGG